MGILEESALAVHYTNHSVKDKITGNLDFGRDTIFPIAHVENYRYICQSKQAKIDKDAIRKNYTRIDHNY